MKFVSNKISLLAFSSLISSSAVAATYTYVGRWQIQEGPAWSTAGLGQTNGRQAAAIKFGGSASDYVISTVSSDPTAINFKAYYVGWGVGRTLLDDNRASTGLYNCGSIGCSYSAWISDRRVDEFNYAFLVNLGPSATDTQAALAITANRLRASYNKISAASHFPTSNTYDCNLFDARGMCVSAGGRYTYAEGPHSHSTAGVVILGYKVSPSIRIGGFLDQSVSNDAPTGIQISNKNPMMGAFVYWNQNPNELGYQVKLANTYQDKDLTLTRDAVSTSESGTGKTGLMTQSYVGELSYAFMYKENTLVRPYFGLRYTSINQDAYTETGVTTPLTYNKLKDETTAALMGVKVKHQLTEKTTLTGSLGVEQDIDHKVGNFVATGLSGLTSENFSGGTRHNTRSLASFGAYYSIAKSQRLSGEVMFQQLPFQNSIGGTVYANYMIGF